MTRRPLSIVVCHPQFQTFSSWENLSSELPTRSVWKAHRGSLDLSGPLSFFWMFLLLLFELIIIFNWKFWFRTQRNCKQSRWSVRGYHAALMQKWFSHDEAKIVMYTYVGEAVRRSITKKSTECMQHKQTVLFDWEIMFKISLYCHLLRFRHTVSNDASIYDSLLYSSNIH